MADVSHNGGKQVSQGTIDHRFMEHGMAHAGADAEPIVFDGEPPQRLHAIDVDEMGGTRQPKRHDRHETLSACEHAPVFGRNFAERLDRFFNALGCVIAKRRRLHRSSQTQVGEAKQQL